MVEQSPLILASEGKATTTTTTKVLTLFVSTHIVMSDAFTVVVGTSVTNEVYSAMWRLRCSSRKYLNASYNTATRNTTTQAPARAETKL